MSVLIKDMKMPESCMDCPFKGFDRAGGRGNICTIDESITLHAILDGVDVRFIRMGDCPLVSADVRPVVKAYWIHVPSDGKFKDTCVCSACKKSPPVESWVVQGFNACPYCFADMR